MSEDIGFGDESQSRVETDSTRRLVPMQVGSATVYVEQITKHIEIQADDSIRLTAPPDPTEAFETASAALQECVRVVGKKGRGLRRGSRRQGNSSAGYDRVHPLLRGQGQGTVDSCFPHGRNQSSDRAQGEGGLGRDRNTVVSCGLHVAPAQHVTPQYTSVIATAAI